MNMKLNKILLVLNILTLIGLVCVFFFYYSPIRKNAYVPKEKYYVDTLAIRFADGELCNVTIISKNEFLSPYTYSTFHFISENLTRKQVYELYGREGLNTVFHHDNYHHDEIVKAYID